MNYEMGVNLRRTARSRILGGVRCSVWVRVKGVGFVEMYKRWDDKGWYFYPPDSVFSADERVYAPTLKAALAAWRLMT